MTPITQYTLAIGQEQPLQVGFPGSYTTTVTNQSGDPIYVGGVDVSSARQLAVLEASESTVVVKPNDFLLSAEYSTALISVSPAQGSGFPVTLNPSDAFGRTQVISEPVPTVMDPKWGAVGDGVTNDTPAIQAALNDVSAVGAARGTKAPLLFPAGRSFVFTGPVVAKSYVDVRAHGAMLVRSGFTNQALFRSLPASGDPTLTHFALRGASYLSAGNENGGAQGFVNFKNTSHVTIEQLFGSNIKASNVYLADSQYVRVTDCVFLGATNAPGAPNVINIVSDDFSNTNPTKYVWVQRNYVESLRPFCIGIVTTTTTTRADPVVDAHINDNTCIALPGSSGSPVYIENGSATVNVTRFDISGNTLVCQGTATNALAFDNDGGSTDPQSIGGVTCRGNRLTGGILAGASNSIIVGNYINATNHDVQLDAHGGGPLVGVTIAENQGGFGSGDAINGTAGATFDPTSCYFDTATGNGKKSQVTYGTAAPATGTWRQGAICWNTTPTATGTLLWSCTTAGAPGTWTAVVIP